MLSTQNQLKRILIVSKNNNQGHLNYLQSEYGLEVSYAKPASARKNLLEKFSALMQLDKDINVDDLMDLDPEPDLIVIESEQSLQDAALINASYAELFFTPEISKQSLDEAIKDFNERKRNFGA